MKEVKIKLFRFEELSEQAKDDAIKANPESFIQPEIDGVYFDFEESQDYFWKLTGFRLLSYSTIGFSYRNVELISEKDFCWYNWLESNEVKENLLLRWINHIVEDAENGMLIPARFERGGKTYISRTEKWVDDMPLTGTYSDFELIEPIKRLYYNPREIWKRDLNLAQVIHECYDESLKAMHNQINWYRTDEHIRESIKNLDVWFYEDGTLADDVLPYLQES